MILNRIPIPPVKPADLNRQRRRRPAIVLGILALTAGLGACSPRTRQMLPDPPPAEQEQRSADVPLDPESPWPKFRANALQNGRAEIMPTVSERQPWRFRTGKGIFSSPVVDGQGNVYVGSADHFLYALDQQGQLLWRFPTGEVIDSSALLDDRGRIYVGSGDGHVYALERRTGTLLWRFRAHTPQEVQEQLGLKTYNVNWFEGNIGLLPDGRLVAPNDNTLVYLIDRDTGRSDQLLKANEMVWSLPAVNPTTHRMFFGSCFIALRNLFAFDTETGESLWRTGGLGSNAASVMLTSSRSDGALLVGGFDGILRAYAQDNGRRLWTFGARDHLYGSPGQLSDGTIIQASADGTVYALDPQNGRVRWAFDTLEPIRSSPAIDARDTIYIGSGEGRLFAINSDGTLRWAYRCIDEERNDLNASPALGLHGVYIAGESGEVFFVPYDYPLTGTGREDPRSTAGPDELLPRDGTRMVFTERFGGLRLEPPDEIDANEPLAFSLLVRRSGDTVSAGIDPKSFRAAWSSDVPARVSVSADRRFVTLVPQETWMPAEGGELTLRLQGRTRTDRRRLGLKFFGGKRGGTYDETFRFRVRPRSPGALPYLAPEIPGEPASILEISRQSAPHPTMLPSWNQIGFDSLHYLLGVVERTERQAVVWGVPAKLEADSGRTKVDPTQRDMFALNLDYDGGLLTLSHTDGFTLSFLGTWDMPYALYRIATRIDLTSGRVERSPALNAIARGDEIRLYGRFLKILGLSDFKTGLMHTYGGMNLEHWETGLVTGPTERVGNVAFELRGRTLTARLEGSELLQDRHVYGVLLVDAESGRLIPANYARARRLEADAAGRLTGIVLDLKGVALSARMRAYLMVDTYPAARGIVETGPRGR